MHSLTHSLSKSDPTNNLFYCSLLVPGTPDKATKQPQTNKWRKAAGKAKLGKGKKNFFGKMRANSVIVTSGEENRRLL